jgi:bidirectional [NiFe] hydrogenase diaphorase subunit
MTKENRQLSIFFPSSPLKFIWFRFMQTANPRQTEKKEHPSGDKRFKVLDITMKRAGYNQSALIEVLHKAQEAFGFLEEDVLLYVARALKLPLSRVYGVATFYHLFSLKPAGETTADGEISLVSARCIGACGIAPAVVFDGVVAPKQDSETVLAKLQSFSQ